MLPCLGSSAFLVHTSLSPLPGLVGVCVMRPTANQTVDLISRHALASGS
jgi:hypothetical protein